MKPLTDLWQRCVDVVAKEEFKEKKHLEEQMLNLETLCGLYYINGRSSLLTLV